MENTGVKLVLRGIAHEEYAKIYKHFENDKLCVVSRSTTLPENKLEKFATSDFETHIVVVSSDPAMTMAYVCYAVAALDAEYVDDIDIIGIVQR